MGEDSGEKTEEPTPHKLREARKKGQIAKSKDLTTAVLLIVSFNTLKSSATFMWEKLTSLFVESLEFVAIPFSPSLVGYLLGTTKNTFLLIVAPLFGANLLVALVVESLQTGFLIAPDSLSPKLEKLNPLEGVKKYFSLKHYVEFLKSLIKMLVIIVVIVLAIREDFFLVLIAQQLRLWQVMTYTGAMVMKIVTRVAIVYLMIAVFDYFYQKYEHIKGLKMSKKEIKDEYKRLEGDPTIKQRQRQTQREMAQGRQMGSVPGADVVVTNPVHLAIAIKYVPNMMKAPKVVAKGKRLIAADIRKMAEQYYVPIIENPPLAQALYKLTQVGSDVPPLYYKAVAEILAFVYNLKKKRKRRY
ncbi:MAG: flagellar biosynthesis protein FlhB [Actinobacteria bacterium]|nr:flagellar biosynthesis protein FlhB [Actinomycetota bacterium]|tara:strand:+ start:535 stop:1605 length:1071 start_codon:yes stop_codon:yes gene_type:complete